MTAAGALPGTLTRSPDVPLKQLFIPVDPATAFTARLADVLTVRLWEAISCGGGGATDGEACPRWSVRAVGAMG